VNDEEANDEVKCRLFFFARETAGTLIDETKVSLIRERSERA